ncbi:ThiF family adenylyltransferase [Methylibium sp. Root1272]|uniref:ThiF family adenylyltransferase n=1 Tax=Methylibium sp. Root1272 TaxID=1736441 RepID=UPI0006F33CDA|nr:ThiF family adenylyltransferase [Methylibium sp. Root1272]KQW69848.1 thiamine biosynthesis protein ThiF [Methylibium sp. Root1272]
MPNEFYAISGVRKLAGPDGLTIARACALADALIRHKDFDIIECLARDDNGDAEAEFLIVEVRCDAVPPNNPHGIGYPERLALGVAKDPKHLVAVHALRKTFPRLMHQNLTPEGAPAGLCLYYEPTRAVQRTWTPQNFLSRIQTWLEKAARDELHAADQPAEQLFFMTPFELVLPWNFDQLRQAADVAFQVIEGPDRPGPGRTYFLRPTSKGAQPERAFAPILLRLQPVIHGRVDIDPPDLGGLADLLAARGLNLRLSIAQAVQEQVGTEGAPAAADSNFSVLLLEIPVSRAEGAAVEHVVRRAYLLPQGPLKLGASCGALMLQSDRYYREQLAGPFAPPPGDGWRAMATPAMEVQQGLDRTGARRQSGIVDEGPTGTFVGAGALGSAVLDLWTRCGWGQWTVIDNDHVKPHNLVRHIARSGQIGASKAQAMAELHDAVMRGAGTMTAIHADACELDNADVLAALTRATLVVDASTTLDYPRLVSTRDDIARHASIFVTPDANGAVLLMEDAKRAIRLRTLEAQYYRALIQHDWGREHLAQHLGKYYSGASCRDISYVMPYTRLQAHAALLAEQLQLAAADSEAAIRIWAREPSTGTVLAQQVPVSTERAMKLGNSTLFIDQGLEEKLRTLRAEGLPSETGGILLGHYDFNVDAVVVVDALAAPADSLASTASFERGVEGVMESVTEASRRTANIVRYIGEWHSHPPGHSTRPSRDDFFQLVYLAAGMAHEGLPALQLIVGDHELSVVSMQVS